MLHPGPSQRQHKISKPAHHRIEWLFVEDLENTDRQGDIEAPRRWHDERQVSSVEHHPHSEERNIRAADGRDKGSSSDGSLHEPGGRVRDLMRTGGQHGFKDLDAPIRDVRPQVLEDPPGAEPVVVYGRNPLHAFASASRAERRYT